MFPFRPTIVTHLHRDPRPMAKPAQLDQSQREIAVKLLRGLLLEEGGDERRLERAFITKLGKKAEGVSQQSINFITRRQQNAGFKSAISIARYLDNDYSYYFEGGAQYIVYGDLPGWDAAEAEMRRRPEGQGLADTAYIGARTFPVREKVRTPVKPEALLRIVKKVDAMLEIKGHGAVDKFTDVDEIARMSAEYFQKKHEPVVDAGSVARLKRAKHP